MCSKPNDTMPISGITTYLRPCPLVSLPVLQYLASSAQRLRQSRSSTVTLSSLTRVSVRGPAKSQAVKLQLVQSLVLSEFYYCYSAHKNHISKEDARRIEIVRNAATRLLSQISYCENDVKQLPMETVRRA